MTAIKLCGLTRPCDIEAANELAPDFIGFVFARRSRRYVSPAAALELKRALSGGIRAVGVFADSDPSEVLETARSGAIDVIQLHGREDGAQIEMLRSESGLPVIKAFRVDGAEDVERACASPADWILLDAGDGGTGTSFDWSLLVRADRPYFLAGGLTPENAAEAAARCRPYGVDVSSGIETDGVKDPAKMRAFVEAVRKI